MVQQPSSPHALSTDFVHHVALFPTRCAPNVPTELPAQSAGRPATARQVRVRTRAIRQVVVLEVSARLREVVEELDWAIPVSYTHLRAHETRHDLVCRLLLEKKKK